MGSFDTAGDAGNIGVHFWAKGLLATTDYSLFLEKIGKYVIAHFPIKPDKILNTHDRR